MARRSRLSIAAETCTTPCTSSRRPARGASVADRYQSLTGTPVGKFLVKNLGLPNPVPLRRYTEGSPVLERHVPRRRRRPARHALRPHAVTAAGGTVGARGIRRDPLPGPGVRRELDRTQLPGSWRSRVLQPGHAVARPLPPRRRARDDARGHLDRIGAGSPSAPSRGSPGPSARRSAAAARSSSCTSHPDATDRIDATVQFLLSPKSAYVSGQVVRIGTDVSRRRDPGRPDRAARRQGRPRHRRVTWHRRGHRAHLAPRRRHVVGVDVAAGGRPTCTT